MTVPEIGISRGATGMTGELLDQDGNPMDPCDGMCVWCATSVPRWDVGVTSVRFVNVASSTRTDYYAMGWECPSYIHVHSVGHRDIIAVKTLMRAAGIKTLDKTRA